ncbi:hypothetical protein GQ53DRAFT_822246 [Thozetella sp. PMI_491]|nr:hypothetical protein GQ53DRAFT_822246 [Thozetella sp. PMI_491]
MSQTDVTSALSHVADILGSSEYLRKKVLIIIPHIHLVDHVATEKYFHDFDKISTFSLANEPGTKSFCAFQSRGTLAVDQIWALEHFDSESSLAVHRTSKPVNDMLCWLQNSKPNGDHPLPVPVPLQLREFAFVQSTAREIHDPFVVITRIEYEPSHFPEIETGLRDFGDESRPGDDVLMYLPGKAENAAWIIAVYKSRQSFDENGLTKKRLAGLWAEKGVQSWEEHFLELKAGYLSRT